MRGDKKRINDDGQKLDFIVNSTDRWSCYARAFGAVGVVLALASNLKFLG